jgi:16S rRNA processing protein RimM
VTAARAAQRICVARIGAPHGVRGEVKLFSFTSDPLAVKDYGTLESEDGAACFEIEALRPAKDHLVARLSGVTDRDAATKLANQRLFVPRARLPAPNAEDEFYHSDLIGLAAVDAEGRELGSVIAIHNFGAGDLVEIKPAQGGATVMLPFTETAVPEVNVAGGRLVVDGEMFASAASTAAKHRADER